MSINPADLKNRVEVWREVAVLDDVGQPVYDDLQSELTEPQKVLAMWAAILPQNGNQLVKLADTRLASTTHKIICRYAMGKQIMEGDWLFCGTERFDVLYCLNPYYDKAVMEVYCRQIAEDIV